jgi:hypothetical protein
MKKYDKQDQIALAIWAVDCAERVLRLFEESYPEDDSPRKAIETCKVWIRTGEFKMSVIRGASLNAHAAARKVKENGAAFFAARAAGQAVATAHVTQHAFGASYYALKAIAAIEPANAESNVSKEFSWQLLHTPENLKEEILKRIIIQKENTTINIKIRKDNDF